MEDQWPLAVAVIGLGAVIFDSRSSRTHALNTIVSEIGAVRFELGNDIEKLKAEVQDTQLMILETSLHTMKAINGNKGPLRKWVELIERCRQSGGEDCGPIREE